MMMMMVDNDSIQYSEEIAGTRLGRRRI